MLKINSKSQILTHFKSPKLRSQVAIRQVGQNKRVVRGKKSENLKPVDFLLVKNQTKVPNNRIGT